jgi:hypothetical protein
VFDFHDVAMVIGFVHLRLVAACQPLQDVVIVERREYVISVQRHRVVLRYV